MEREKKKFKLNYTKCFFKAKKEEKSRDFKTLLFLFLFSCPSVSLFFIHQMTRRVGDYELLETIGTGAFSKVKLCKHTPTMKQYVAKILPKTNKEVEAEVRVEISILRRVKHDNVVQLHEILESPRNFYIILEPVLGGDLCSLIMERGVGMPEAEAAMLFGQLACGVNACHSLGVAHRDLKPENLLLTPPPNQMVKISDFGLSRLHSASTIAAAPQEYAKTLTGTLAYVAPEVLRGPYDAFKADLWSMGCILYVMLTCKFPFGGAQGTELEEKIKAGALVPLPDTVSPAARNLVMALMRMSPSERLPIAEVLKHPFVRPYQAHAELTIGNEDLSRSFGKVEDDDEKQSSPNNPHPIRRKLLVPH